MRKKIAALFCTLAVLCACLCGTAFAAKKPSIELMGLYAIWDEPMVSKTSVYKGYKQDKIEMRGDRAEMSDFPLYLNTVAGGLDRRDQTIGGFSFVVKIYAVPVVEIIGQLLYLLGRYGFNAQFSDCL